MTGQPIATVIKQLIFDPLHFANTVWPGDSTDIPARSEPTHLLGKEPKMTNTTPSKVALVTGASSGIGEATALELVKAGYTVYAAARRVERMNHLTESGIRPIVMDVTDNCSMQVRVEKDHCRHGSRRRAREQRGLRLLRRA